jgi:hypothetical protein
MSRVLLLNRSSGHRVCAVMAEAFLFATEPSESPAMCGMLLCFYRMVEVGGVFFCCTAVCDSPGSVLLKEARNKRGKAGALDLASFVSRKSTYAERYQFQSQFPFPTRSYGDA